MDYLAPPLAPHRRAAPHWLRSDPPFQAFEARAMLNADQSDPVFVMACSLMERVFFARIFSGIFLGLFPTYLRLFSFPEEFYWAFYRAKTGPPDRSFNTKART